MASNWLHSVCIWPCFRYFTIRVYTQVIWNVCPYKYLQLDKAEQILLVIYCCFFVFFLFPDKPFLSVPVWDWTHYAQLQRVTETEVEVVGSWLPPLPGGWIYCMVHILCDWQWLCVCWWKHAGQRLEWHSVLVRYLGLLTMNQKWMGLQSVQTEALGSPADWSCSCTNIIFWAMIEQVKNLSFIAKE